MSGLVQSFQGNEGTWRKYIYMMLAEVKNKDFLQGDEAKFLDFMITSKCGVDFFEIWIVIG
jgi:hypothetical protein